MRGMDGDPSAGFRLNPSPQRPPAREYERVRTVAVDHGKLKFDFERRGTHGLPHASFSKLGGWHRLDLAQSRARGMRLICSHWPGEPV
jgi:hypothetical protein